MKRLLPLILAPVLLLSGNAHGQPGAAASKQTCPTVTNARATVGAGNVVNGTATVTTPKANVPTRLTIRRASTGAVAFSQNNVLEYLVNGDELGYTEELPVDQPRQRMVWRVTVWRPGCAKVWAESAFMSQRPAMAPA